MFSQGYIEKNNLKIFDIWLPIEKLLNILEYWLKITK